MALRLSCSAGDSCKSAVVGQEARRNVRLDTITRNVIVLAFVFWLGVADATTQAGVKSVRSDSDTLRLSNLEGLFQQVAAEAAPTVVAISVVTDELTLNADAVRSEQLNGETLDKLIGRIGRVVGTGVVFDEEGYILTNEHVIGEARQIWVTTDRGDVHPAIVVGSDPWTDIAVLKAAARLPAAKLATGSDVRRGQWTITLGNPVGLAGDGEMSMSVGVVSGTGRSLARLGRREHRLYDNLIQTTAEVNPGNSGGPLFDLNGNVIGIITAVVLPQGPTDGIGFAIPIDDTLLEHVRTLRAGREIVYGTLGVTVRTPTNYSRRMNNLPAAGGAEVDRVEAGHPADGLLLEGDVILCIAGRDVSNGPHLERLLGGLGAAEVSLLVNRGGKLLKLDAKLATRSFPHKPIRHASQRLRWQGMTVGTAPSHWAGADAGLIVTGMDDDSPMAEKGLRVGSIITRVAGRDVDDVAALQTVLNDTTPDQWHIETTRTLADASAAPAEPEGRPAAGSRTENTRVANLADLLD